MEVKKEKTKKKIKGKAKGKAIIGIAMAAIMIASVLAAMAPMGIAQPFPPASYSGLYNYITLATNPPATPVLIGQDIWFHGTNNASALIKGDPMSAIISGELFTADSQGKLDTAVMTKTGIYYVNPVGGTSTTPPTSWDAKLAVANPTMALDLKVSGTSVSSITEGTLLEVDSTNNLDASDMVSLVITDPDGVTIKVANGQYFDRINVSYLTSQYGVGATGIDTTGWKLGEYTFKVATKKDTTAGLGARGLDACSNEKTLTVLKAGINIDAEKTSAVELETVKLTVTGVTGHIIRVITSDPIHTNFPAGVNDNQPVTIDDDCDGILDAMAHIIGSSGKRTYAVEFTDSGYYMITVKDVTAWMSDTVDITVSEKAVTFDVPSTVTIGEKFTIKGTANTGTTVDIAVEGTVNALLNDLVIDQNGEFSKEIDTATAGIAAFSVPGSVRLKAYIDRAAGAGAIGPTETEDGSVTILMTSPSLTVELSNSEIAQGDEFTVSGTAPGSKCLNILAIAPNGSSGTLIDGTGTGIYNTVTSVSEVDGTFSKKIRVGPNVDTGSYLVAVLSPGRDDVYNGLTGNVGVSDFMTSLAAQYNLASKTQEQLLAIIQDATVEAAGSDDLLWTDYIKVGSPFVTLDPIASVTVGEPLVVTGTTNREEGFAILVTVKGPVELTPQTVEVENGTFNATFDTTGALAGTYTVKADDGDGHTDTATVEILPAISIFDTGAGTYPSISGTHNGTITSYYDINVSKIYTYSCSGTGGHTEYVAFYNATTGEDVANGTWNGYQGAGDYHYIEFDSPFVLKANVACNYTIKTGSYPQIIHAKSKEVTGGMINCTEFTDANGKKYNNWIPAIRLE